MPLGVSYAPPRLIPEHGCDGELIQRDRTDCLAVVCILTRRLLKIKLDMAPGSRTAVNNDG
jgi:hypothetical protein